MVILSKEQQDLASKEGLWLPQLERDACGVGFVCSIKGIATNKVSLKVASYSKVKVKKSYYPGFLKRFLGK